MLVNTMAKIKDMTVAMTELLKDQANFRRMALAPP